MKTFGGDGIGLFFAPRIVEKVIMRQYGVETVGVTSELKERFHLLTVPRKMNHPALSAIIEHARQAVSSQSLPGRE